LISKAEFEKEELRKIHNKESKSLTDFIPIIISYVYGKLKILHFYSLRCDISVTNWTNKMHTLQYFHLQNPYTFRASLAYHQGVPLYKTIARPYYHHQYVEPCWDNQCMIYRRGYVH